jgi:hypothetical protein
MPDPTSFLGGTIPLISPKALWLWDTSSAVPTVSGYPSGASWGASGFTPTKTGLAPADLKTYCGVPLQFYGNPPVPIDDDTIQGWIRYAEDWIEQESTCLLCQTYIASPPAYQQQAVASLGITLQTSGVGQVQGFDFDLSDAAYDFIFQRAQDEGWMITQMRYRPVRSVVLTPSDFTAIKRISFIYPLLNEIFSVPPQWVVEDGDFGLIRMVPAANVQMLPLFAMQLAFMGFAESVPGALWFQYTAGLTPNDYQTRFSFVKQLVLATASIQALATSQGSINLGATDYTMSMDGVQYATKYPKEGPYSGLIKQNMAIRDTLLESLKSKVSGPMVVML